VKGNNFKTSFPSSRRKETHKAEAFPKTFQKAKNMTDLSFPIMKLQHRAAWERECLAVGTQSCGSLQEGFTVSDMTPKQREDTVKRAEACERAIQILKNAQ
jgi:hypothetical protein